MKPLLCKLSISFLFPNRSIIDVMPCDESVLGFTNRWYPEAIAHRVSCRLPDGQNIWIFSPIYFLASKVEAFRGRGKDWRYSKDM